MIQPLFEVTETGRVMPLWPLDPRSGEPIEPDGKARLTAAQASQLSGESEASHNEQFRLAFAKWLDDEVTEAQVEESEKDAREKNGGRAPTKVRLGGDLFRALFYPHFAGYDAEWDYYMSECARRKLNPRSKEIFAELKPNEVTGRMELVIYCGIAGFRRILDETGRSAGNDEAQFTYGDDPYYPVKCVFTLYMMVHGQRCPFVGRAKWLEYNPEGEPTQQYRREKPEQWLSKIAEADAIRRAAPERASDLYERAEMESVRQRNARASARPAPEAKRGQAERATVPVGGRDWTDPEPYYDADEDAPASEEGFRTVLISMGFATPAQRKAVTRQLQDRLTANSPREFWAKAVRELRDKPQVYGAKTLTEV